MKEYLKCKACSYIMDSTNPPAICPACGVPDKAFEPYKFNLSSKRKLIIDLDLHPMMIHLPQSISGMIIFFGILSLTTEASWGVKFLYTVEVITYLLPLSVIASVVTGLFDGKNRFKKLTTPALKKKIIFGVLLVAVTAVMPLLVYLAGIKEALYPVMGLSIAALAIQAVLARIGIKLFFAWLPG